jgi:hypothetical protein
MRARREVKKSQSGEEKFMTLLEIKTIGKHNKNWNCSPVQRKEGVPWRMFKLFKREEKLCPPTDKIFL